MEEPIVSPTRAKRLITSSSSLTQPATPRKQHSLNVTSLHDSPRSHRNSLDTLLQTFEAQKSPTSVTKLRRKLHGADETHPDMELSATCRTSVSNSGQTKLSTAHLSPSEVQKSHVSPGSPCCNRHNMQGSTRTGRVNDRNEASIDQLLFVESESTDRTTVSGRPLRPRAVLSGPAGEKGVSYYAKGQPPRSTKSTPRGGVSKKSGIGLATLTDRLGMRHENATVIQAKADRFVSHYCDLFLPLLPKVNYISELPARHITSIESWRNIPQPDGINAILKPYQLLGLSFLVHMFNNGMSAILGDEMGLGKTLQTLSLFQYLKQKDGAADVFTTKEMRPFLVLCPLAVLENWISETKKFLPGFKVLRIHGSVKERSVQKAKLTWHKSSHRSNQITKPKQILFSDGNEHTRYDLVITTYEAFQAEQSWFKRAVVWRYVVLDEGHKIKNYNSSIAQSLQSLNAEYRLLLTGTPLQNSLVEMWSLLHWLFPKVFVATTLESFKSAVDWTQGAFDPKFVDQSRKLLELIMLRRMKDSPEVALGLPAKDTVRLFVPLTPLQRKWYLQMLTLESGEEGSVGNAESTNATTEHAASEPDQTLAEILPSFASSQVGLQPSKASQGLWRHLLNLVVQLRKICTHPYLIPDACPQINAIGPHVLEASGKFMALRILIEELVLRQKRKVLIFSGFTEVLDWVEDLITYVSNSGERFDQIRFDGSTRRARRNLYVRLFQQASSSYMIMLISTRAGGIGINLTAATAAIFIDEDWNPQIDLQAEARCHRIGQTQPVDIYKLCSAGTVEEQMLSRIHKKLYLSAKIFETMQSAHGSNSQMGQSDSGSINLARSMFSDLSDIRNLLRRGTKTLVGSKVKAKKMETWDFHQMIKNCHRTFLDDEMTESEDVKEDEWLSTIERVECTIFEGQRYARKRVSTEVIERPMIRSDRRSGMETTIKIDGYSVNKASLDCANGEAVPTLAGKDPSLKSSKRSREAINHESVCLLCKAEIGSEQDSLICKHCPRNFHPACLGTSGPKNKLAAVSWACAQHRCSKCQKKANDAGGMIFRCRTCIRGYCEDCLKWDSIELIGDTIEEYRALDFGHRDEAYYIICEFCRAKISDVEKHDSSEPTESDLRTIELQSDDNTRVPEPSINARLYNTPTSSKRRTASSSSIIKGKGSQVDPLCISDDDNPEGVTLHNANDSKPATGQIQYNPRTPCSRNLDVDKQRINAKGHGASDIPSRSISLTSNSGKSPGMILQADFTPQVGPSQIASRSCPGKRSNIHNADAITPPSATRYVVPNLLSRGQPPCPPAKYGRTYRTPSSRSEKRSSKPSRRENLGSPSSGSQISAEKAVILPDDPLKTPSLDSKMPATRDHYKKMIGNPQTQTPFTPSLKDVQSLLTTPTSAPTRYHRAALVSSSSTQPRTPSRTPQMPGSPNIGSAKRRGAEPSDESVKRRRQDYEDRGSR